jgi:hypothetical protein
MFSPNEDGSVKDTFTITIFNYPTLIIEKIKHFPEPLANLD